MSEEKIKISITPFIVVGIIIFLFVFAANFWNEFRTKEKVEKVKSHAQEIYKAHKSEFVELAKSSDNSEKTRQILSNINNPEKGNYKVHVLLKTDSGFKIRDYSYLGIQGTNLDQDKFISELVKDNEVVGTEKTFFNDTWREGNILAFVPIIDEGKTIGFVLVEVDKTRDI